MKLISILFIFFGFLSQNSKADLFMIPMVSLDFQSPPPRAQIFGMTAEGQVLEIERNYSICIQPGDTLRLLGDGVNYRGERGHYSKKLVHWWFSYDDQPVYAWNNEASDGPFRWGDLEDSVFLKTPSDLKKKALVQNQIFSRVKFDLNLVNPDLDSTPCHWMKEIVVPSGAHSTIDSICQELQL